MLNWFPLGLDVFFWLPNWYVLIFSLFEDIHFALSCICQNMIRISIDKLLHFYFCMCTCLLFLVFVNTLYKNTEMGFWKSVHIVFDQWNKESASKCGLHILPIIENVKVEKWKWFCLYKRKNIFKIPKSPVTPFNNIWTWTCFLSAVFLKAATYWKRYSRKWWICPR